VTRLLRASTGVADLDGNAARARVREQVPDADPQDLLLFDDLLGIADPGVPLPQIDPDARRRRLTAASRCWPLSKAFADLRADFFVPDLVFIHPSTLGAVRRLRDQNKRLQLVECHGKGRGGTSWFCTTSWPGGATRQQELTVVKGTVNDCREAR